MNHPGGELRALWGLAATPARALRALEDACAQPGDGAALDELRGDPLAELVAQAALPTRLGRVIDAESAVVVPERQGVRRAPSASGAPANRPEAATVGERRRLRADPTRVAAVLEAVRGADAVTSSGSPARAVGHGAARGAEPVNPRSQRGVPERPAAGGSTERGAVAVPRRPGAGSSAPRVGGRTPAVDGALRARAGRAAAPTAADQVVRATPPSSALVHLLEESQRRAALAEAKTQPEPQEGVERPAASASAGSRRAPQAHEGSPPPRRTLPASEVLPPPGPAHGAPPSPVGSPEPEADRSARFGGSALARLLARAAPSSVDEVAGAAPSRTSGPALASPEPSPASPPRLDHVRERARLPDGADLRDELARILAHEARRHGIDPTEGEG